MNVTLGGCGLFLLNCCLGKFYHGKQYFSYSLEGYSGYLHKEVLKVQLQKHPVLLNNRVAEWVENGHITNYNGSVCKKA